MSAASSSNRVRAEAAKWFARAHSGEWDERTMAQRDAWLAADSRHAYEYRMLESIWRAAADIPEDRLQALAMATPRRLPVTRRQAAMALGLGALAVGLGVWKWPFADAGTQYRTALGARKRVTLPDGSAAELNSASHIVVQFDESTRRVELLAGEAVFSVAKDAQHPFVVDARIGTAVVTGTSFSVRRERDQLSVVVESGSVNVSGQLDAVPIAVVAGNMVRVGADGHAGVPQPIDATSMLAWRSGQIVFRGTDLADAAREVSRYRPQPVILGHQASLKTLQVSGVFRVDDTDAFLAALPHFLPVRVQKMADGRHEIIGVDAVTK